MFKTPQKNENKAIRLRGCVNVLKEEDLFWFLIITVNNILY